MGDRKLINLVHCAHFLWTGSARLSSSSSSDSGAGRERDEETERKEGRKRRNASSDKRDRVRRKREARCLKNCDNKKPSDSFQIWTRKKLNHFWQPTQRVVRGVVTGRKFAPRTFFRLRSDPAAAAQNFAIFRFVCLDKAGANIASRVEALQIAAVYSGHENEIGSRRPHIKGAIVTIGVLEQLPGYGLLASLNDDIRTVDL